MLNILKKVFGCNWEDELELSKVIKKNERETLTNISYIMISKNISIWNSYINI